MGFGRQAFRVEGLRELDLALQQLSKANARNVVERTMMKAAEPFEATAKALAPKKTGSLAESITIGKRLSNRQRRRHRKTAEVEVFVGADALPHAHLQEFGTSEMPAHPFMRPAWEQHKEGILKDIGETLGKEIQITVDRVARRASNRAGKFNTRRSKG